MRVRGKRSKGGKEGSVADLARAGGLACRAKKATSNGRKSKGERGLADRSWLDSWEDLVIGHRKPGCWASWAGYGQADFRKCLLIHTQYLNHDRRSKTYKTCVGTKSPLIVTTGSYYGIHHMAKSKKSDM